MLKKREKLFQHKEGWQSDRMRWTRNPVYALPRIGGLNPSPSAKKKQPKGCFFCVRDENPKGVCNRRSRLPEQESLTFRKKKESSRKVAFFA